VSYSLASAAPLAFVISQVAEKLVRCAQHAAGCTYVTAIGVDGVNVTAHATVCRYTPARRAKRAAAELAASIVRGTAAAPSHLINSIQSQRAVDVSASPLPPVIAPTVVEVDVESEVDVEITADESTHAQTVTLKRQREVIAMEQEDTSDHAPIKRVKLPTYRFGS
jgi:hypothetical protein